MVLWIDHNISSTRLIEKAYKSRGMGFYTISSAKDFAYLLDYLRPEIIVLDAQTILDDIDLFKDQYLKSPSMINIPVIIIGEKFGLEFITNRISNLKRPFDPFNIPDTISDILSRLRDEKNKKPFLSKEQIIIFSGLILTVLIFGLTLYFRSGAF
jgi:hypothetical protein